MTRRSGTSEIVPSGGRDRRVFVGKPQTLQLEGGGTQSYRAGDFYMVPEKLAAEWIEADAAVDPEDPPTCPECGATATEFRVEGAGIVGPRQSMAAHVAGAHPRPAPGAPVAQPTVELPPPAAGPGPAEG